MDANYDHSTYGCTYENTGTLNNNFFINLLSMDTVWTSADDQHEIFEGRDRKTGQLKWTATRNDPDIRFKF